MLKDEFGAGSLVSWVGSGKFDLLRGRQTQTGILGD